MWRFDLIKLKDILLEVDNGSRTQFSTDAEKIIEICINHKTDETFWHNIEHNQKNDIDAKFIIDYYNNWKDKYNWNNISMFKDFAQTIKGDWEGARNIGDKNAPTTKVWQVKYNGITNTKPKTDVSTNGPKFSVKNGGTSVRVLDASEPQFKALLLYSIEKSPIAKAEYESINSELKRNLIDFTFTNIKMSRKGDNKHLTTKELVKNFPLKMKNFYSKVHDAQTKLQNLLDNAFQYPGVKYNFVKESISGLTMLGRNSEAAATHLFTWNTSFTSCHIMPIDRTIVDKIVNNWIEPKVSTKSFGNYLKTTIQASYKNMNESLIFKQNNTKNNYNYYINEIKKIENKFIKLNTTLINEGYLSNILDYGKELINKGKDLSKKTIGKGQQVVSAILDELNNLYQLFKEKIIDFINALTESVKNGISYIIDFFDIEIKDKSISELSDSEFSAITADELI